MGLHLEQMPELQPKPFSMQSLGEMDDLVRV